MLFSPGGHGKLFWQQQQEVPSQNSQFLHDSGLTGARVSEVRALTVTSIDLATDSIVIECLKRRRRGIYRAVPVPREIILLIDKSTI